MANQAVSNPHMMNYERVIAAGGVEVFWIGLGAAGTAGWTATRKNDLAWALGESLIGFLVAGASREDSRIRDLTLGVMGGAFSTLTIRLMGHLARYQGQQ